MASSDGCDILYVIHHHLLGSREEPLDGLAPGSQNLSRFSPFQEDTSPLWVPGPDIRITHRSSHKGTC